MIDRGANVTEEICHECFIQPASHLHGGKCKCDAERLTRNAICFMTFYRGGLVSIETRLEWSALAVEGRSRVPGGRWASLPGQEASDLYPWTWATRKPRTGPSRLLFERREWEAESGRRDTGCVVETHTGKNVCPRGTREEEEEKGKTAARVWK